MKRLSLNGKELLGGWWKETLELRVWLHDFGAIEVLRVLGVLVRAHATAVLVRSRSEALDCVDTRFSITQIRVPFPFPQDRQARF